MEGHSRESHGHKSKYYHHHRDHDRHHNRHHHRHRKNSSDSSQSQPESSTSVPHPPLPPPVTPVKEKSFKLLVDPCLVKGARKLYRIDGAVPGEPSWNVVSLKDPRPSIPRRWTRPDVIDLPVPRFKIDSNYIGDPPEVEITITNLNDNIDKQFLTELVCKHGEIEELVIFYHPVTRKHTGIARVVFTEVSSAANCVAALNSRSVMGKQLVVFQDPFGREWTKMVESFTAPKKEVAQKPGSDDEDLDLIQPKEKVKETLPLNGAGKEPPMRDEPGRPPPSDMPVVPAPEEKGGTSPFSHKTPACNPSPAVVPVHAYPPPPIPSNVPLPDFNRPPPPLGARTAWPVHNEWRDNNVPWQPHPWGAAPPFMSPPHTILTGPAPPVIPPDSENPLDLDTRIELLLKGGMNGMAPPFLAMDINSEESAEPPPPPPPTEEKIATSRSSSVSSEDRYSPPPLPPGVDLSPTLSPAVPIISEYSSDKYLPLSTPPSPFISEEEYLECLLNWRLKHLSYVQEREKQSARKRSRHLESDKVSEISSEEHEADFTVQTNKDDDRMSLSSLSSVAENIEQVSAPSNLYGSYTFGDASAQPAYPPESAGIASYDVWRGYPGQMYPSFGVGHPLYNPLHPPPMQQEQFHPYPFPIEEKPMDGADPLDVTVDLALDRVCELITATLEKDLMKRMTEVLAFNEFEKWWESEEKKYKEENTKEPEKLKDVNKEDVEEKKSTTDALLNSIIDANYDGLTSGFGLGFRAALPKMPSFKRKQRLPSPGRGDRDVSSSKEKRNESDEEEMVQLSDSESQGNEPESMMQKKRLSDLSSVSSATESSESSSNESESESSESDSDEGILKASKEDFLKLIDSDKLEEMRAKTPEERLTPIPAEDFSDFEDVKDSDKDSRASSPSGSRHLRKYAMEALQALGLDEFVCDVKIRDGPKPPPKLRLKETIPVASTSREPVRTPVVETPKLEQTVAQDETKPNEDEIVKKEAEVIKKPVEEYDSEGTLSPHENLISVEHSYSLPKVPKKENVDDKPAVASWIHDHDYSGHMPEPKPLPLKENASVKSTTKERKKKSEKLVSHLLDSYLKKVPPPKPKLYSPRDPLKEMMTCYEFLTKGVDQEDVKYLKRAFEGLLADESQSYWLNDMHWANHPVTDLCRVNPKRAARGHQSGCARTQGFYKLDPREKQKMKHHYGKNKIYAESMQAAAAEAKGWTSASREARSNQRRLLTAFGADTDSDLLKFNQLKFRKKLLKFGKSEIHDWGLFAMEPIAADEMVIEYVGQKVRPFLADYREQKYQKRGIGSSYLFRIDLENIVDATHCGNLARFINHSCNPNCYAKIITIESQKKIVIYSKRDIKVDEEITYDYKFPLEEEKIACLCGDVQCKGFLN